MLRVRTRVMVRVSFRVRVSANVPSNFLEAAWKKDAVNGK